MDGFKVEAVDSESAFGYTQITTSYTDFSIAEMFGKDAIKDTYHQLLNQFKNSYKELTELVMVLNWKIWRWYEENNDYAELYNHLWEELESYALVNLRGEELAYYYRTTD